MINPVESSRLFHHHLVKTSVLVAAVLSVYAFTPGSSGAQESSTTATIAGAVRDTARAAIPGATITLRNLATNQTRRVIVDAEGNYRVTGLTVGDYEIRSEVVGFAPYLNPKVTLALGGTTTLDISLVPPDVNARVTVTDRTACSRSHADSRHDFH
jgi:hypothetical protein